MSLSIAALGFVGVDRELLQPILLSKIGRKEEAASSAKESRKRIEQKINRYPLISDPDDWSGLAICAAWENDQMLMKRAMENARELTAAPRYKFLNRVKYELHIAFAYLLTGNREKAIETLVSASKMESPHPFNRKLLTHFQFDELRGGSAI